MKLNTKDIAIVQAFAFGIVWVVIMYGWGLQYWILDQVDEIALFAPYTHELIEGLGILFALWCSYKGYQISLQINGNQSRESKIEKVPLVKRRWYNILVLVFDCLLLLLLSYVFIAYSWYEKMNWFTTVTLLLILHFAYKCIRNVVRLKEQLVKSESEGGLPTNKQELLDLIVPKPWYIPGRFRSSFCKMIGGETLFKLCNAIQELDEGEVSEKLAQQFIDKKKNGTTEGVGKIQS